MLHLTAGNIFGGVERTLQTIALESAACPEMETEMGVCFNGRFASDIRATNVPIHHLGAARARAPWSVFRARRNLRRVMLDRRIDVLVTHATWPHAMFAPVAKKLRVPVVLWLHAAFTNNSWLENWAALTSPDGLIFNSQFTKENSTLPERAIPSEVIYNPVRHQTLSDGQEYTERAATRRALGIRESDCVIAQIGRIEELKGHTLLLKALALLPEHLRWTCLMVGGPASSTDTNLLNKLKSEASELGILPSVRFLGDREDIAHILAASDIVVQPNVEPDSFGNSVIEALWHRLPVVATDMGGPAEILRPNYGILVPPNDPDAMAAEIRGILNTPETANRIGERGPKRAFQLCDPLTQLRKLHSFFEIVENTLEPSRGQK